jgi:23S rRNA (cytosine1962-C5)-methyltransferase
MSGSVEHVVGKGEPGELVRVVSHVGRTLGYGHYSPDSQIRVRMLWSGEIAPAEDLLEKRIDAAIARRKSDPLLEQTNAVRWVNAEGDGLPGLIADRFADVVVLKLTTAGMLKRREEIARVFGKHARTVIARADETAAKREGVESFDGLLHGSEPEARVWIEERGRKYAVDVTHGQKTGFYLDQRDSRDLVQQLSRGRSMLDLYSHTGGLAISAAKGGATKVVLVETSSEAMKVAEENASMNDASRIARFVKADVHKYLREETETFDVIAVDPPPLAKTKKDVDRAARAYKDAFLYAMKRANAEAFFLAWSCSHHVGRELLGQIIFGAALDAKRTFQVLKELDQPSDHAVSVDHPEGRYLTGLLLRAQPE